MVKYSCLAGLNEYTYKPSRLLVTVLQDLVTSNRDFLFEVLQMNINQQVSGAFFNPTKGIYKITNTVTGRVYIGQSRRVQSRLSSHFGDLADGKHSSRLMQADWTEYGPDSFSIEVVEHVDGQTNRLLREAEIIADALSAGLWVYNTVVTPPEVIKSNLETRKARQDAKEKAAAEKKQVLDVKIAARAKEHDKTEAGSHKDSQKTARRKNDIFGNREIPEHKPGTPLERFEQRLRLSEADLRLSQEGVNGSAETEGSSAAGMDANGLSGESHRDISEVLPEYEDYNENEYGEYVGFKGVSEDQWLSDSDGFLYAIQEETIDGDDLAWFLRTYVRQGILEAAKPVLTGAAIFSYLVTEHERQALHKLAAARGLTWSQYCQQLAAGQLSIEEGE